MERVINCVVIPSLPKRVIFSLSRNVWESPRVVWGEIGFFGQFPGKYPRPASRVATLLSSGSSEPLMVAIREELRSHSLIISRYLLLTDGAPAGAPSSSEKGSRIVGGLRPPNAGPVHKKFFRLGDAFLARARIALHWPIRDRYLPCIVKMQGIETHILPCIGQSQGPIALHWNLFACIGTFCLALARAPRAVDIISECDLSS